jgi:glycine/D-amino acid oxidase-like deaminating enzyme/nitrite reductase/ring-hydroxylating ferredoxin subunit
MNTESYWLNHPVPHFETGSPNCRVDVAVIGGGITGVTTAYLLKKAGYTVALIERGSCGGFDTSNTTAHLTCVTDTRLSQLVSKLGKEVAQSVWTSGAAAIDQIEAIVQSEKIDCEFRRIPGYLHCSPGQNIKNEAAALEQEAQLANELDFAATFKKSVPFFERPGIEFPAQAKFHPLKYLGSLLKTIPGHGSHIFDHSEAGEISAKPLSVKIGQGKVRCSYLVLATHNPLMGNTGTIAAALFQTKLFLYTSYVVGARVPRGAIPEASYWDTEEPYHYLRIDRHRDHDYAIYGGEDHKTGQVKDTARNYDRLEAALRDMIPEAVVDRHWSGQVIETPDGLPFIGETADRQFVATGFGGNGTTFGTVGAMMAVDCFLKRESPWAKLFDVHRTHAFVGTGKYLRENKDYPVFMVKNWLHKAEEKSLASLKRNEGRIIKYDGHKVAAFRNAHGKISIHSAVCTHLQCIVEWNPAEKTWDCPCHGSRFASTGEVLSGPAEEPLAPIKFSHE